MELGIPHKHVLDHIYTTLTFMRLGLNNLFCYVHLAAMAPNSSINTNSMLVCEVCGSATNNVLS